MEVLTSRGIFAVQNMGMVLSSRSLFAIVSSATGSDSAELDLFRLRSSAHLIYIFDGRKAIFGDFEERKSVCVCVQ